MGNILEVNEAAVFNALKYRKYASVDTMVGDYWIRAGNIYWVNEDGQLHRADGPAVEWANGTKIWYLNGQLHREDGPAIEQSDGVRHWYRNGKYVVYG